MVVEYRHSSRSGEVDVGIKTKITPDVAMEYAQLQEVLVLMKAKSK